MKIKELKKLAIEGLEDNYIGYYDFSDGVSLSEGEKKKIVGQVIDGLKEKDFYNIATGNFIVFAAKYKQTNGKYTVYIVISENYKQISKIDVEL